MARASQKSQSKDLTNMKGRRKGSVFLRKRNGGMGDGVLPWSAKQSRRWMMFIAWHICLFGNRWQCVEIGRSVDFICVTIQTTDLFFQRFIDCFTRNIDGLVSLELFWLNQLVCQLVPGSGKLIQKCLQRVRWPHLTSLFLPPSKKCRGDLTFPLRRISCIPIFLGLVEVVHRDSTVERLDHVTSSPWLHQKRMSQRTSVWAIKMLTSIRIFDIRPQQSPRYEGVTGEKQLPEAFGRYRSKR